MNWPILYDIGIICLCSWTRSYLPPKNIDRKPWPDCDVICCLSSFFNTLELCYHFFRFFNCWYLKLRFVTHNFWKKVPKSGHGVNLVSFWSRKTNLSSENVNAPEQENSWKRTEYKGERRLLTSFWRNWRQKLIVYLPLMILSRLETLCRRL